MGAPQTINGLMRHLRNDCNISIGGSYEKSQLISYGYYHGYKGYRFVRTRTNQVPYTKFSEVVAVIEYDNNLKSALYPCLMFIETAIKNIVCNAAVVGLRNSTFDHVYKERMNDNISNANLQAKRLKLRNSVYGKLADRYQKEDGRDNQMVRHFYNRGEDVPLWGVFEILYLSDLASFFDCLNKPIRENILKQLNIYNVAIDTNSGLLSAMLYTLKSLRNAIAHNAIIFDTRFKDRNINRVLKAWTEHETGINNITLYSLIDYIIVTCCLLKQVDFSGLRAKNLLDTFKQENANLQQKVDPTIYSLIVQLNVASKIAGLEAYINL